MGKKPAWFKGIFPALVTPFRSDGSLDEEAYRELIRFLLPHVDGFLAAGTTGEFVYLSSEERKRVIEITLEEAGGKVPVIAGTGAPSTRETLELTRFAKAAGADAALVVTPFYLKPTYNEIYDHYRAVDKVGDSHHHLQHTTVRWHPPRMVDGRGVAPGPGKRHRDKGLLRRYPLPHGPR